VHLHILLTFGFRIFKFKYLPIIGRACKSLSIRFDKVGEFCFRRMPVCQCRSGAHIFQVIVAKHKGPLTYNSRFVESFFDRGKKGELYFCHFLQGCESILDYMSVRASLTSCCEKKSLFKSSRKFGESRAIGIGK